MKVIMHTKGLIYLLSLTLVLLLGVGCGGRKPPIDEGTGTELEGKTEIDELLGISAEEDTQMENPEDEVLKLLGISEEKAPEAAEPTPTFDESAEAKLKQEIADLERQLSARNAEIAELKSEIAIKDQKISSLEDGIKKGGILPRSQTSASTTAAPGTFRARYESALSEYENKNYRAAISIFEELLATDPNNSLSDNCQYWIGECYYGLSNYNQAIVEFEKVFSFPKSNKSDDAQLKLGLCYLKLGDREKAREEFERLISNYPQSEYVEKAQTYLSRL